MSSNTESLMKNCQVLLLDRKAVIKMVCRDMGPVGTFENLNPIWRSFDQRNFTTALVVVRATGFPE